MKKSVWNYMMIGVLFVLIVLCFIPFFENGCCLPGYDQYGNQTTECSYSWESVLSRFARNGTVAVLVFVLYLIVAGSATILSIINVLPKRNKKLAICSIVLTSLTLLCFPAVISFAIISYPTC